MQSKKLLIIIVFLILTVLGGAGGLIYYFMHQEESTNTQTIEKSQINTQDETLSEIGPLYPLAPFTVNLQSPDDKDVYLKITLSLELNNKLLKNELDAKNAVLRDNIILILSSKSVGDLASDMGKKEMCDEIKDKLNSMLNDGQIRNVYIVSFIIQ
jgi:flagellar FliL protein